MNNRAEGIRENERALLDMIEKSSDPAKAITVAIHVIRDFLKCSGHQ